MKKKAKLISIYDFEDVGPCAGCCDGCNDCGRNSTPHAALISQLNKSRVELIVENKKLKQTAKYAKDEAVCLYKEITRLLEEKKKLKERIDELTVPIHHTGW